MDMGDNDINITVVYSTRKIDPDYFEHVKSTCALPNMEVLVYENNGDKSLTEIYNDALSVAKHDIIVFCHDDLIFETKYWGKKLFKHFKRNPEYGIIGLAGTNNLISGQWWAIRESMHGIVNHSDGIKKWISMFSKPQGNLIKEMIVLDGVLFAVDRTKIKHSFDESFKGFHFYDLSFCFPNHLDGVKVGVITDILITHMSVGHTNQYWEENKKLFEDKYKNNLPIKLK